MHLLQSATESHKKLVYREEKKEAQRSSKEWWKWYWCLCNSRSSPFLRPVAFQPLVWVFLFLFLKALFSGLNALKLDSVTCKERVLTQTAHLQAKVKGRGQLKRKKFFNQWIIFPWKEEQEHRGASLQQVDSASCCVRGEEILRWKGRKFSEHWYCHNTMYKNLPGAWDNEVEFERRGKCEREHWKPSWVTGGVGQKGWVHWGPVND